MAAITTSVDVDRPVDEVFAYATDPTRFREWQVVPHQDQRGAHLRVDRVQQCDVVVLP